MATLFSPLTLGSVTIANRMSPLTRDRADVSTVPNALMKEYYLQRAAGGAGLIVTQGTLVTRQGSEWPQAPGIWNEEQTAAWKPIVDAIHTTETKVYCQLWHLGRASHPDAPEQIKAGEATCIRPLCALRPRRQVPLPSRHIGLHNSHRDQGPKHVDRAVAALNAKEAGFDGVELHGVNGYLIHQFLDSTSNIRTDKWGVVSRTAHVSGLEVLKVMVEVFGADVGVKLAPAYMVRSGYNDMGMPLQETLETYKYFISEADKLDLSYIVLSRYALDFEAKSAAEAEKMITAGTLDAILFGVLWIAHPDLTKRVRYGKPLDNTPNRKTFYGHSDTPAEVSFTDYPAFSSYDSLRTSLPYLWDNGINLAVAVLRMFDLAAPEIIHDTFGEHRVPFADHLAIGNKRARRIYVDGGAVAGFGEEHAGLPILCNRVEHDEWRDIADFWVAKERAHKIAGLEKAGQNTAAEVIAFGVWMTPD
ncbi:hypothetical protein DFH07DRAFT_955038 [Mycena maculata]|uniref:NADH:flavin oxidoreductase/NADH oxidase N-terminal domain-containing protein n=1 Tax=Mycena maculata TaxID=230809 RepID=A0AAD7JLP3_9AGAR|nr:hypothetical protein DFH07DRAFT_955038 [Mycena maculata]